jgi:hypothetical protein
MRLDQLTIAVRERSLMEVWDLAFLVMRKHGLRLLLLLAVLAVPATVLDLLLLDPANEAQLGWLVILVMVEAPLVTAPLTAYLGEATFSDSPSLVRALGVTAKRFLVLIPFAALRTMLALLFLLPLLIFPRYAVEVLLLERQPFAASQRRMKTLREGQLRGVILSAVVLCASVPVLAYAAQCAWQMLAFGVSPLVEASWYSESEMVPTNPILWVVLWCVCGFLTIARFLGYLDIRTRLEGWEIELELRRLAARDAVASGVGDAR